MASLYRCYLDNPSGGRCTFAYAGVVVPVSLPTTCSNFGNSACVSVLNSVISVVTYVGIALIMGGLNSIVYIGLASGVICHTNAIASQLAPIMNAGVTVVVNHLQQAGQAPLSPGMASQVAMMQGGVPYGSPMGGSVMQPAVGGYASPGAAYGASPGSPMNSYPPSAAGMGMPTVHSVHSMSNIEVQKM